MEIGSNLKKQREAKGLTLSALAEKSGIQVATLSRIENLKMTGTIESHIKIAQALGLEIGDLYNTINREKTFVESSADLASTDVFIHSEHADYEILTNRVLSKKMMPVILRINSKGQTKKQQNPAGSEKFIFVLEGSLTIHVEDKTYLLSKTHSLYFDASRAHYFENTGKDIVKILSVTTPANL